MTEIGSFLFFVVLLRCPRQVKLHVAVTDIIMVTFANGNMALADLASRVTGLGNILPIGLLLDIHCNFFELLFFSIFYLIKQLSEVV